MSGRLFRAARWLMATLALVATAAVAGGPIPTLYSTGVDDNHQVLPNWSAERHWDLLAWSPGNSSTLRTGTPDNGFPIGPWYWDGTAAAWIGPTPNADFGSYSGDYIYRTTFDLTGYDPSTATIDITYTADDGVTDIWVNGTSIGNVISPGFNAVTTRPLSGNFVSGTNTILVFVRNGGNYGEVNPSAMRAFFTSNVEPLVRPGPVRISADTGHSQPAGTVSFFPHVITASAAGTLTVATTANAAPAVDGWQEAVLYDPNCNGVVDSGEGPYVPLTVTSGQTICVLVREVAPPGAAPGFRNVVTVTASIVANSNVVTTGTASDDTTIVGASVVLRLLVRNVTQADSPTTANAAAPGDVLEYQLTAINVSSVGVNNLVVNSATPTNTTFVSAACPPLPVGLTACAVGQPAAGAEGPLSWTFAGMFGSGASLTTNYRVAVKP